MTNRVLVSIVVWIALAAAAPIVTQTTKPRFREVSAEVGITFVHENGATPEKRLPETMGGGVIVLDVNNDSWMDLLFVNSGHLEGYSTEAGGPHHRVFVNDGGGTFTDRTAESGIDDRIYGMGACAGDVDDDGWVDVYLTGVGQNILYKNLGDGTFEDVTRSAGVESDRWGTSCAFGDIDNDGNVDLYVANYLVFSMDDDRFCGDHTRGIRTYCHPNVFDPEPDLLFLNAGDGTFTDISQTSGIGRGRAFGLGVVFTDFDDDGYDDIYVANDSVPNYLFRNRGDRTFEEVALLAGVAVGPGGQPLAGMGTTAGDVDGDGLPDLFVTNLDRQTHSLYRNLGGGLFSDVTIESGVAEATLPYVGFGATFLDFDNDSDLDLAVANGDILDNVEYFRDTTSYGQVNLLLENDGSGQFRNIGPDAGPGFRDRDVSRALASGDIDNDGDLDLVVVNNGQTADVLRNDSEGLGGSVVVTLVGDESSRQGIGARIWATFDGKTSYRRVRAGSSYLSQRDPRVHFGVGTAETVALEVHWPSGVVDRIEGVYPDGLITVREGRGLISAQPFENAPSRSRP